jgi:hypothetical protein
MKAINYLKVIAVYALAIILFSCEKENEQITGPLQTSLETGSANKNGSSFTDKRMPTRLSLTITGLAPLGDFAKYEGWIIVDGNPVSTGRFVVNENGQLAPPHFNVNSADLTAATMFVLTIEPNPDPDPAPSATHILAGAFTGNTASLSVSHPAALGNDFLSSTGSFLLATPTTSSVADEDKGVWFIDNTNGPMPGLSVPSLPIGWKYEGWVVINGIPVTTGTFLLANVADEAAPFSGNLPGPPFPGEDFIMNAPSSLIFPPDLNGAPVVITIEPSPDNSPAPFSPLRPLVGAVPVGANVHTTYSMSNNAATFPTGSASR